MEKKNFIYTALINTTIQLNTTRDFFFFFESNTTREFNVNHQKNYT